MSEPTLEPDQQALSQEQERRLSQLQHALQSRIILEQAKGILRERFGLTIDQAFDLLRTSARSNRQKIHELAAEIVANHATPGAVIRTLAGRSYRETAEQHRLNQVTMMAGEMRKARMLQARDEEMRRRR